MTRIETNHARLLQLVRSSNARRSGGRRRDAFTLVELLIVVVILGILATIVLISIGSASRETEQATFVSCTKTFAEAAWVYMARTGEYLEDSSSGQLPSGWEDYVDEKAWTGGTPINGVWDFELDSFNITSGFGVHFMNGWGEQRDDGFMGEIDALFDDGELASGVFRKIADDRFYYILEP